MNFVPDIDNLDDYCFNLITDEIAEKAPNDIEIILQKGSCENDKVNYFIRVIYVVKLYTTFLVLLQTLFILNLFREMICFIKYTIVGV